jgi:EAL domain-containing protein (putative c-di-GMP-specific phosphodiesterase class I)
LKELPISSVKIDKSFVDDVINNVSDQYIISALLDLGGSMGFKLILEGIETIDQRDFLREMGFTLAQGYYYSPPIKASQVPAFCQQYHFGHIAAQCVAKSA